jgi:hypothetical protein
MKRYIGCVLFFAICAVTAVTAQELNLDMEHVEAYAQPAVWKLGHDPSQPIVYRLLADSVVKHGGLYSLKITSNSNRAQAASCFMQIGLQIPGKTVTLKGFLKTENVDHGFATLFLGLCNDTTSLVIDKQRQTGQILTGTQDWKEFSITLPCSKEVTKINLGGLLAGAGTVWVDDLTLLVDDTKIVKAPVLQLEYKDPKTGEMRKFK